MSMRKYSFLSIPLKPQIFIPPEIFMGSTALFGIIHEFHCTILVNFYFYLQYF